MIIKKYENGSKNNIYNTNKSYFFVLFFGLIMIVFIILTSNIIKVSADTEPPANGDWIIEKGEDANLTKNHTMNGNVIVNGSLTIDGDYSLEFDCNLAIHPPNAYGLIVNKTGKLLMNNSGKIKALVPENKDLRMTQILIWGTADIQNCKIEGVMEGIICERGSNITISDTTFKNCGIGIVAVGFPAPIKSNEFIDVDFDIIQYWNILVKVVNENDTLITKGQVNLTSSYGNYTRRTLDENGTVHCDYIKVKEGDYDYNPFILRAGAHYDENNETPHLTHESNFYIDKNYDENPKIIKINDTLSPDFSIRTFSCKLSFMELGKTNELHVWIRNMGEAPNKASIKFSGKPDTEDNYMEIETIEEKIPANTTSPHHKVYFNWTPKEAGNYDIIVEVKPLDGIDPYLYDDNSPTKISIRVLHYPKIEIETPKNGSTKRGVIDVTGTFEGLSDRIHVWMQSYVFSLDLNYTQYLKNGKICEELNNTFKNNNCSLSNMTYIIKKDNQTWEIVDWTNWYRGKIVNITTELQIYLGKFSKPYKYDDKNHKWYCKLDSGEFNEENQIIYANISVEGGMFFDEDEITISLTNEQKINIKSPKNNEILTAVIENDKIYVWGYSWKATPRAPDIEDVELIIDGKKRIVILEKKNETYWKWHFEWNIASNTYPVKDGNYVIQVQCTDNEERKSEVIEITVTINNSAPYSKITIPTIKISTSEPIEPVNEEILIKGTAKDDFVLIKIEGKVVNRNWFTIIDNINKKETNWEYKWFVKNLGKGTHTIYFRAVDEETDEHIIHTFYKKVSFNITKTKYILPDLSIENVVIMKNGTATTNAKNSENLTFEITIKVQNADKIPQPTTIYFKLSEGEKSLSIASKTIDKSIADTFSFTITWTVYGIKGTHNYTIEVDKGNYLDEEKENNNLKNVSIEILDSPPPEKPEDEKNILSSNIKSIIFALLVLSAIIFIFFLLLHNKNVRRMNK